MAPESIKQREYSKSSDMWMWANTVVEILTGKPPFDDMDTLEVAVNVKNNGMHPAIPNNCPIWLRDLLLRCWSIDPRMRPLASEISQVLDDKMDELSDSSAASMTSSS